MHAKAIKTPLRGLEVAPLSCRRRFLVPRMAGLRRAPWLPDRDSL